MTVTGSWGEGTRFLDWLHDKHLEGHFRRWMQRCLNVPLSDFKNFSRCIPQVKSKVWCLDEYAHAETFPRHEGLRGTTLSFKECLCVQCKGNHPMLIIVLSLEQVGQIWGDSASSRLVHELSDPNSSSRLSQGPPHPH